MGVVLAVALVMVVVVVGKEVAVLVVMVRGAVEVSLELFCFSLYILSCSHSVLRLFSLVCMCWILCWSSFIFHVFFFFFLSSKILYTIITVLSHIS